MKAPLDLIRSWLQRSLQTRDPNEARALVGRALSRLDELKGTPADLAFLRQQWRVARNQARALVDVHDTLMRALGDLNELRDKYELALRLLHEARTEERRKS